MKNVIWIVTDQQRADTLSINGSENSATPNLDILARTGINFKNAISGFPLCCPFRGSMLTGLYPHKCVPGHEFQLDPNQETIANVFNDNNYDTAYFGKWHLDGCKEREKRAGTHFIPRERRGGFATWLGYENNNVQYDCYVHGHAHDKEIDMYKLPKYETDALFDLFSDYLDDRSKEDKPFFAVLSIQPPHDPYVAPAEFTKKHTPANIKFKENVPNIPHIREQAATELSGYYAMVENIDYNVGRIVEKLNETNLMDDTHIIYFSDHGDMHGSHGQFRKTNPYQESVSIPFILSGENRGSRAAKREVGDVYDVLVNHVDIAPTSLGLCGIDAPSWMEGTDYSSIRFLDKENPEFPDSLYMQCVIPTGHGDSVDKPWRGIVTKDGYKYVCFENCEWLLFDLKTDPNELVNLTHNSIHKDLRARLKAELQSWIDKTEDKFSLDF